MTTPLDSRRLLALLGIATAIALAVAGVAAARMTSTKISPTLCETTGGGKFVAIPGFPGEMIDRRLLADIRWLRKRYPIFITDGYSMSDVHAEEGEHPIGLALDIVPDKAAGGRWSDITRLARWAEPKQDQPRAPFRWVGYDGDEGHGRGDHLHLSWSHSETRPGFTAKLIDTIRCPDPIGTPTEPPAPPTGGSPEGTPPDDGQGHRGRGHRGGGHGGHGSGGIGGKLALAAPVVETDGVGLGE
jgi:hypothetical protein